MRQAVFSGASRTELQLRFTGAQTGGGLIDSIAKLVQKSFGLAVALFGGFA